MLSSLDTTNVEPLSNFAFKSNLRRYIVATAAAADATAANTAGPLSSVAATDADVALVAAAAERAVVVSDAVAAACAAANAADNAHAAAAAAALKWQGGAVCPYQTYVYSTWY